MIKKTLNKDMGWWDQREAPSVSVALGLGVVPSFSVFMEINPKGRKNELLFKSGSCASLENRKQTALLLYAPRKQKC